MRARGGSREFVPDAGWAYNENGFTLEYVSRLNTFHASVHGLRFVPRLSLAYELKRLAYTRYAILAQAAETKAATVMCGGLIIANASTTLKKNGEMCIERRLVSRSLVIQTPAVRRKRRPLELTLRKSDLQIVLSRNMEYAMLSSSHEAT